MAGPTKMPETKSLLQSYLHQIQQDPTRGQMVPVVGVEFGNLASEISNARKALRVRDAVLDRAVNFLLLHWVTSDTDIAQHLGVASSAARQVMLFIAGQLRTQVTLRQDNARGWVMRVRLGLEGGLPG